MGNNSGEKKMILDNIENIAVDLDNPPILIEPIKHLPIGMHFIANNVRELEIGIKNGGIKLDNINNSLLTNYFHWFANTSVNYLRYIALIDLVTKNNWKLEDLNNPKENAELVKIHCKSYVEKVIPEVLKFRNKISAHYSSTDPLKKDSASIFHFSGYIPVGYLQPYFQVGIFNVVTNGKSSEIPQWSLTAEYDKICERCLPSSFKLPIIQ